MKRPIIQRAMLAINGERKAPKEMFLGDKDYRNLRRQVKAVVDRQGRVFLAERGWFMFRGVVVTTGGTDGQFALK